jgi:hypothetical protein
MPFAPLLARLAKADVSISTTLLASIFREALLRERLGLVRLCLQD